jgi:hypothetical protein
MQEAVVTRSLEMLAEEIRGLVVVIKHQNKILLHLKLKSASDGDLSLLDSNLQTLSSIQQHSDQLLNKLAFLK